MEPEHEPHLGTLVLGQRRGRLPLLPFRNFTVWPWNWRNKFPTPEEEIASEIDETRTEPKAECGNLAKQNESLAISNENEIPIVETPFKSLSPEKLAQGFLNGEVKSVVSPPIKPNPLHADRKRLLTTSERMRSWASEQGVKRRQEFLGQPIYITKSVCMALDVLDALDEWVAPVTLHESSSQLLRKTVLHRNSASAENGEERGNLDHSTSVTVIIGESAVKSSRKRTRVSPDDAREKALQSDEGLRKSMSDQLLMSKANLQCLQILMKQES